jgi:hypothetical protein
MGQRGRYRSESESGENFFCQAKRGDKPLPTWGGGESVGTGKLAVVTVTARAKWSEGARHGRCFKTGSVTIDLGRALRLPLIFFQYLKTIPTCKFKLNAFSVSKNTQTWHEASFEDHEQLSTLAHLQIPTTADVINFGTDSNLNLP